MLNETIYETTCYYAQGHPLLGLWDAWEGCKNQSFSQKREIFLWMLERLLREGRIKLHKNGVFLATSIEEQVEQFRLALPASEEDADKVCTKPGYEPAYEGFGMNVWWFLDICPAGVAWRMPGGSYQIAD